MKATPIGLILVSAFFFGCPGTGPKVAVDAPRGTSVGPIYQPASTAPPGLFAQDIISLETGLACANGFHPDAPIVFVFDGSPPPPTPSVSPVDFGRRDMSLIDDTGSK